jgi:hypothetical protein
MTARLFGAGSRLLLGVLLLAGSAGSAPARTITLTADDCDQIAILSAKLPRASWLAYLVTTAGYNAEPTLQFYADMAILMRFPLEQVPKGQRIVKAELMLTSEYTPNATEIGVRRLLADWGHGACHQYRMTFPKKQEWDKPGGRGAATDRAAKESGTFKFAKPGEHTVDVTADVDLWYTGATMNRGWILTIDNSAGVYLSAPYSPHYQNGKRWKLQITFEPQ